MSLVEPADLAAAASCFNLNDHRLPRRVVTKLLAAVRKGDAQAAADWAHAVVVEAATYGLAAGCDVDAVLAAARDYVDSAAALDKRVQAPAQPDYEPGGLVSVCAADVVMRPIDWLWPTRIARGKVTLIAGDPGLGKTQLSMSLAAIVTAGMLWPVSDESAEPGDVLLLSAEDDPEDTLVPRAKAAGADLARLHIVQAVCDVDRDGKPRRRAANLADDLAAIELKAALLPRAVMIIIDPVSAYLGRADSHNNAEVRALLAPVSELAARCRLAVVCISHLNKSTGPKALQRVVGSIAFTAAARAAYLVAREAEDSPRRVFVPLKNNLGTDRGGYAFEIEPVDLGGGILTSRIRWADTAVDVTADDLLSADSKPASGSALDAACQFLVGVLDHGEVAVKQIEQQAARQGVSWRTVERAAKSLGVAKRKETGKGGRWLWALTDQTALPR